MILSFIAGFLELIAAYILGNKNKLGWLLDIVVDFIWIYLGFLYKEIIGIWVVCVPGLVISVRNYILWSVEEQQVDKYF